MRKLIFSNVDPGWRVFAGALALTGFFSSYSAPAWAQGAAGAPAGQPTQSTVAATSKAPEKAKAPDKKAIAGAQAAFQAGSKAFETADYTTALAEFQKANALAPTAVAQYWIAVSTDKGDASGAQVRGTIGAYEAFLALPDVDKAGTEKIEGAKARVTELKATLEGVVSLVTNPAGASINVDGMAQPGITPATLNLKPGAHRITLNLTGYEERTLETTVQPDQKQEQNIELAPVKAAPAPAPAAPPPPPPPPAPEPEAERSLVPAYVTLGVAGASAVVGTIFGVKALGAKSDFDDKPTTDNADSVERNALIADMAFGVAVTLGVTGIVLLTSDEPEAEQARAKGPHVARARLDVAPYASPTGGGARALLTF